MSSRVEIREFLDIDGNMTGHEIVDMDAESAAISRMLDMMKKDESASEKLETLAALQNRIVGGIEEGEHAFDEDSLFRRELEAIEDRTPSSSGLAVDGMFAELDRLEIAEQLARRSAVKVAKQSTVSAVSTKKPPAAKPIGWKKGFLEERKTLKHDVGRNSAEAVPAERQTAPSSSEGMAKVAFTGLVTERIP